MPILLALNGVISAIDALIPIIDEMVKKGELSPEQQADVRAKYDAHIASTKERFAQSHWQVVPD